MMKKTTLITCLALSLLHPVNSYADLPDLGEVADASLTLVEENKIGRQAWQQMQEAGVILDDAEVSAYLQDIGGGLSSSVKLPGVSFTYFVVNDNAINAFAMPGGYVGVNIGLILATQSEGELASVLGHETAHVAQRHIARMKAASSATSPILLIGTILAAALASKAGGGDAAMGAVSAGMGLSVSNQLAFSRDFEREADRIGMQYMSQAGFDVRNMPEFFQRLQQTERYSNSAAFAFLRTHPVTVERISEAENRALDYPVKMREDSVSYLLVREKLRVLTMGADEAVSYYQSALARGLYLSEGAQWYGLSLAKLRQHDVAGALQALNKARGKLANHPMLYGQEVAIASESRNWPLARQAVDNGLQRFPNSMSLQLARIDVAIASGDNKTALELLRVQLNNRPTDASLYRRQANVYVDKDPLRYHFALGSAFYYEQRYSPAMEQFQLASKAKGEDFYLRSSLDARVRELDRLLKEERQQKK
ncbi:M48 family metalloprotease [Neisseriaceae bacterium TC5R-5]|nr:M48 family metalloprotease [Neisseriaceae bacterium TC5R-5]